MKRWQQTYEVEQAALGIHDDPVVITRSLRPCNALAPKTGVTVCLKPFAGCDSFCQQVKGHPGAHTKHPSACNRPAGHDGPHAFLVLQLKHGYEQLAGWT